MTQKQRIDARIAERVAAYEAAVAEGRRRYGAPGHQSWSAVSLAAEKKQVAVSTIISALRAVSHDDWKAAVLRRLRGAHRNKSAEAIERSKAAASAPKRPSRAGQPGAGSTKAKRSAAAKAAKRRRAKSDRIAQNGALLGERFVEDPVFGRQERRTVNLAEHPAELLRGRGVINEVQYRAAGLFRAAYEAANVGAVRGIDPTREFVDGGMIAQPIINGGAFDQLRRYRKATSEIGYLVLIAVIGCGLGLDQVTRLYAEGTSAGRDPSRSHLTRTLVDALDDVAVCEGLNPTTRRAVIRFARNLETAVCGASINAPMKSSATV